VQLLPQAPAELVNAIRAIESIPALADIVASFMDLKTRGETGNFGDLRLEDAARSRAGAPGRRIEVLKVSRQIDERTREAFDERQKEAVLRERLRQIKKELGETDTSVGRARGPEEGRQGRRHAAGAEEQAQRELEAPGAHAGRPPNIP
jgi:ATP-dependent Lon protease